MLIWVFCGDILDGLLCELVVLVNIRKADRCVTPTKRFFESPIHLSIAGALHIGRSFVVCLPMLEKYAMITCSCNVVLMAMMCWMRLMVVMEVSPPHFREVVGEGGRASLVLRVKVVFAVR